MNALFEVAAIVVAAHTIVAAIVFSAFNVMVIILAIRGGAR
ncbi:hypothetical protein [Microlunatus sp. Y2014]